MKMPVQSLDIILCLNADVRYYGLLNILKTATAAADWSDYSMYLNSKQENDDVLI